VQRTRYEIVLGADARVVVDFAVDRRELRDYSVVLVATYAGSERTVRCYDNAHGEHEVHRYTLEGEKQPGETFNHGTADEALRAARAEVESGWEGMIEAWRRT
jgi:hypothetical protein